MTIDELIQNFYVQKELIEKEIEQYDKDFSNKKLNLMVSLLLNLKSVVMHLGVVLNLLVLLMHC